MSATIRLDARDGVTTATIDHRPVNLYDDALQRDLAALLDTVEADGRTRVLVLESADPDFFVAHYDVAAILAEETGVPRITTGPFSALMRRFHESAVISIAKVRGAARGGGAELLLALDLRFAALERAVFGFPEAALGILAAGGGTQRLPAVAGRARALELLLGAGDLDAALAERYGLVNRALPDAELDAFVEDLAARIARRPPQAIAFTKLAVNRVAPWTDAGYALEALLLDVAKAQPDTRARLARFTDAGGQTRAGERAFQELLRALDG